MPTFANTLPIGVFDSGFGGLSVLSQLILRLPHENTIFVGDSARCPYGTRKLEQVQDFTLQICSYLVGRGCKLIVIACNTATAAGLAAAQKHFTVPIVGVVQPGARAACAVTQNRRVGVIATSATINSQIYTRAIHNLDSGIEVFAQAAPQFVDIAERGAKSKDAHYANTPQNYTQEDLGFAHLYLDGLKAAEVDTLVLGCTHFPLIQDLIAHVMGGDVELVSSAVETAVDVAEILRRRGQLAPKNQVPTREFYTTSPNVADFSNFGTYVLKETGTQVNAEYLALPEFII